MKTSFFEYTLPESLIAQCPVDPADHSRLCAVDRASGQWTHDFFYSLPFRLSAEDVLVFNNTQVLHARLFATRESGGQVEILLIRPETQMTWAVFLKPAKRVRIGERLTIAPDFFGVVSDKQIEPGIHRMVFHSDRPFLEAIRLYGQMPLPPYITPRSASEFQNLSDRYQTVFAESPGAVAAPTAGLHFMPRTLEALRTQGVQLEKVTLHVGPGTFQPIQTEDVAAFDIHREFYQLDSDTARRLTAAKAQGKRLIAVGTTAARVLQTCWTGSEFIPGDGWTRLYIYPGGPELTAIDGLLTNFHLPRSSLLVLVSAFAGTALTRQIYEEAVRLRYRFFSFGDCMLIL